MVVLHDSCPFELLFWEPDGIWNYFEKSILFFLVDWSIGMLAEKLVCIHLVQPVDNDELLVSFFNPQSTRENNARFWHNCNNKVQDLFEQHFVAIDKLLTAIDYKDDSLVQLTDLPQNQMEKVRLVLGLPLEKFVGRAEYMRVILHYFQIKVKEEDFAAGELSNTDVKAAALHQVALVDVVHDCLHQHCLPDAMLAPNRVNFTRSRRQQLLNNLVHLFVAANQRGFGVNRRPQLDLINTKINAGALHYLAEQRRTNMLFALVLGGVFKALRIANLQSRHS